VIDDFEAAAQAWETFWQDGSETRISCASAQDQVFAGSQALKIEFNVQPDTWATCELNLGENQDWSAAKGISFAIRASDPAMVVDVLVFGNDPGARVPYVFSLETSPEIAEGWRQVELTWDMLVQPEYEANPGTPLDASKVNGLVFAFNTFPGTPSVGTIWIDELVLSGGEISKDVTAPAEQPQDQPDSPGQGATEPPTAAEQQPAAQGGRGLCSTPLFLLGLALWGSGLIQRSSGLARITTPATASASPVTAGSIRPCPFASVSPNTVTPNSTLTTRVVALLAAIAGARKPVFSADCTSARLPFSSAAACSAHPLACSRPPAIHTGLRMISPRKRGSPSVAFVCSVPLCCSTDPSANAAANSASV
jgi:hypothetical protein